MASTIDCRLWPKHGDERDREDEHREGLQDVGRAHDEAGREPGRGP